MSGVGCREKKDPERGGFKAHQKKKIHVETHSARHEASLFQSHVLTVALHPFESWGLLPETVKVDLEVEIQESEIFPQAAAENLGDLKFPTFRVQKRLGRD